MCGLGRNSCRDDLPLYIRFVRSRRVLLGPSVRLHRTSLRYLWAMSALSVSPCIRMFQIVETDICKTVREVILFLWALFNSMTKPSQSASINEFCPLPLQPIGHVILNCLARRHDYLSYYIIWVRYPRRGILVKVYKF